MAYKMNGGKPAGGTAYDNFSAFQKRGLISSPLRQIEHPGKEPILGEKRSDKWGDFQFSGDTKGIKSKTTGLSYTPGDSTYKKAYKRMLEQHTMRAGDYSTQLTAYKKQEEDKEKQSQIAGGGKPTP